MSTANKPSKIILPEILQHLAQGCRHHGSFRNFYVGNYQYVKSDLSDDDLQKCPFETTILMIRGASIWRETFVSTI